MAIVRRSGVLGTCKTCPAYFPADPEHPDKGGSCRPKPPTPLFMGVGQDALGRQQPLIGAHWAGVGPNDCCLAHPMNQHLMDRRPMEAMPFMSRRNLPDETVSIAKEPIGDDAADLGKA